MGCSDVPTRIQQDPLVGHWSGTFIRSDNTPSRAGELEITVCAGGDAVVYGNSYHQSGSDRLFEHLYIQLLVQEDGSSAGQGNYLLMVAGLGTFYVFGDAEAQFDRQGRTVSGTIRLDFGESGYADVAWQAAWDGG